MKKIIHNIVRYQCDICKTKYETVDAALACEKLPVEYQAFKIGDAVTWREKKACSRFTRQSYYLNGTVNNVKDPAPIDEEYNNTRFSGRLAKKHVYMYVVDWVCPHCKQERSGLFYGMELVRL